MEIQRTLSPRDRGLIERIALLVALLTTLMVGSLHYFRDRLAIAEVLVVGDSVRPYWQLLALEVPVWFGWALLVPALLRVADAFPVVDRRRWAHTGVHLVVFPLAVLASAALITLGRWPLLGVEPGGFLEHVRVYFFVGLAIYPSNYALTLLGHHAFLHARHLQQKELDEARVEGLLARARLQALQSQVQPHFLFNALNGISGLVGRDDVLARRLIAELGALLRTVIEADDEEIPLRDELAVLERYLALQGSRYGDRLRVSRQVAAETLDLLVPRFALQPLVENAVKHGVERRRAPVEVLLSARVEGERLVLTVADDGPGLAADARDGVGLANLRERLRVLHGGAQALRVESRPAGGTEVTIVLPATRTAARPALAEVAG